MNWILYITLISAWLTHVAHCFAEQAWGLLIAGAIMVPIAVINGIVIWFA